MSAHVTFSRMCFYSVIACSPWKATPSSRGTTLTATVKCKFGEDQLIELEVDADKAPGVLRALKGGVAQTEASKPAQPHAALTLALGFIMGAGIVLLAVKG